MVNLGEDRVCCGVEERVGGLLEVHRVEIRCYSKTASLRLFCQEKKVVFCDVKKLGF